MKRHEGSEGSWDSEGDTESQEDRSLVCCADTESDSDSGLSELANGGALGDTKVLGCIPIKAYSTLVRLRTAYALGTSSVLIVSVTLGISLQIFFSVFEGMAIEKSGWLGFQVLFFTPLFFLLIAALADEMWDMLLDSLDVPPLCTWRAYMMAVGLSPALTDALFIGCADVLPIVFTVCVIIEKGRLEMSKDSALYMVGCQITMTFLALLQLLVKIFANVTARDLQAKTLAAGLDRRRALVGQTSMAISANLHWKILDHGGLDHDRLTSKAYEANEEYLARHQAHAWKHLAMGAFVSILVVFVLGALSIGPGSFLKALLAMSLTLIVLARLTKQLFQGLLGNAFNVLIGLFISIAFGLIIFSYSGIMDLDAHAVTVPNIFEPPPPGVHYQLSDKPVARQYPVCSMRWGREGLPDEARLSILDLVMFSDAVYMNYDDEIASVVRNATDGTYLEGVETLHVENRHTIGRWGLFRLNQSKALIIAIRGTTGRQDAMGDADMYASVKVMQMFNQFLPVISLYPASFIRNVVGSFAAHKHLNERPLWWNVTATALRTMRENPGYDVIVTGHSLGGALAIIAGSYIGAQAVAFSPPGQRYSSGRFGVSIEKIEKSVTTVQPRKDFVPEVDQQIGFTQKIECDAPAVLCHSVLRTACTLFQNCGDVRGRTMHENCGQFG